MNKTDTTPTEDTLYVETKDLVVKTTWAGVPATDDVKECYRCQLEMRGPSMTLQRHCPRCCYDNDTIAIGDPEISESERLSWIAAVDLGKIYFNWARGYCHLMEESQEADYSNLDDFMVDIMEQSFPYLHRLVQEKIINEQGLAYVRACANEATILLLTSCLEWEEYQRLQGSWGDKDDEYKEYWLKRQQAVNKTLTASTTKRVELEDSGKNGGRG